MSYKDLIYSVEGKVATVTLNRPERMNALSRPLEAEMRAAFDEADADRKVRAIILTGAGAAFSAGYDQAAAPASGVRPSDPKGKSHAEYIEHWERLDGQRIDNWTHLWSLGKPVIAAVNGWAMGGGFWWQLACDLTIASDKAVFAQPEVRHISNTSYLLTALCGWKVANRWALTGDHFDAQEAYRIGMINEVVPHDELMPRARCARRTHRAGAGTVDPAQQGDRDEGHSGRGPSFRAVARRRFGGAGPFVPQRRAREAVRSPAQQGVKSLSGITRRPVPSGADGSKIETADEKARMKKLG